MNKNIHIKIIKKIFQKLIKQSSNFSFFFFKINFFLKKYGNYEHYYQFRNNIDKYYRINLFVENKNFFEKKKILDIGCNSGELSYEEIFNFVFLKPQFY